MLRYLHITRKNFFWYMVLLGSMGVGFLFVSVYTLEAKRFPAEEATSLLSLPADSFSVLVIPILLEQAYPSGSRAQPTYSTSRLGEYIFTTGNIKSYWNEQSGGIFEVTGDILPDWIRMADAGAVDCRTSGTEIPTLRTPEVAEYFARNPILIKNYNQIVFLVQCQSPTGLGGSSELKTGDYRLLSDKVTPPLAWVRMFGEYLATPSKYATYTTNQLSVFDAVFAHEIGHGIGLLHAHGFDCLSQTLFDASGPEACAHVEYGNSFDMMGTGLYGLGLSAPQKQSLGWIDETEVLTIKESGTYILGEQNRISSFPRVIYIDHPDSGLSYPLYALEYRDGTDMFDEALQHPLVEKNTGGVLVRALFLSPPYTFSDGSRRNVYHLLDTHPTQTYDWDGDIREQAVVGAMQAFSDPVHNLSITVEPITTLEGDTYMQLMVEMGKATCDPRAPSIAIRKIQGSTYLPTRIAPVAVGKPVNLEFSLQNTNFPLCGAREYEIEVYLGDTRIASMDRTIEPMNGMVIPVSGGRGGIVSADSRTLTIVAKDKDLKLIDSVSVPLSLLTY
ncbi:MAG: M6 family metalloprotease-like protein [Planctomycetota bacterium]|jgi:M6 family metalloprotease-like protein